MSVSSSLKDSASITALGVHKRKPDAWDHFTKNRDNTFNCNYCATIFGSGSNLTTIKRHLSQKHAEKMQAVSALPRPFNTQDTTNKFISGLYATCSPLPRPRDRSSSNS